MARTSRIPIPVLQLPPDGRVLSFLRLLWAVDHGLQVHSKRMAARLGVTGPQRLVVRVLSRFPGLSAGELASVVHLHPSTLTGILQRLEQRGLVAREVDAADRRKCRLRVTARARKIDAARGGTVEAEVEKALASLSPADVAAAERVLTAVGARLRGRKR